MTTDTRAQQGLLEWTHRAVGGRTYLRAPIRTRWLDERDDLVASLREYLPPMTAEDTVVVSEKVAILLTGRAIPVGSPGRVARAMSRFVRPPAESYGLSVPEKMQFVVDSVGVWRVFAAAAVSAMTRPIGVRGVFYRVAGPLARDVDGALPPYEHLLFPPLPQADAAQLCAELQSALGVGVCIADLNDFGGRIRAASPLAPPIPVLSEVLADNPLGQRLTGTPFGVIRPLSEES